MLIAFVSLYPESIKKHSKGSGVASYAKNLVKNIPLRKTDKLYIICNKINGKNESYTDEDGYNVIRTFDRNFKYIFQIYRQITRISPDVVHIQQEVALYGKIYTAFLLQLLVLFLRLSNKKVVVTLHHVVSIKKIDKQFVTANNSSSPTWLVKVVFYLLYRPLIKLSHKIIVHEQCFKSVLKEEYSAKDHKIHVVEHGVENLAVKTSTTLKHDLNIPEQSDVYLFMGYLAGYKGFDLLIEGFAEYIKINKDAVLIIGAGMHPKLENDPTYINKYHSIQTKTRELIPQENFRWVGFIDEAQISDYYTISDASLYPYIISMSSSGPMSIAIGYEKPFLASNVFEDVLPKQILFERSANALKNKLEHFSRNKRAYMGVAKSMKESRLWPRIGNKTMDLYEEYS